MKLLVQYFLENYTFRELQEKHGVYASFSKCGSFWSMNYDQLESKENDLLAQQCRGVILAKSDHSSLLKENVLINDKLSYTNVCPGDTTRYALPFFRFFNEGQGVAAKIDWHHKTKIYNKEDGTCIILWHHPLKKQWIISTRGSPEANVPLNSNSNLTFSSLFKHVLKGTYSLSFEEFTSNLDINLTYIFELCSIYNRIVVDYKISQIFFIGARNTHSMQEFEIEDQLFDKQIKVPRVKSYNYSSVYELVNWVSTLNPLEHEGVVVRDSNFNRIKIKNAAYVAYNKLHDRLGYSERNCMELVLLEKDDDVASFLPDEIIKNIQKLKLGLQTALHEHDEFYHFAKSKATNKKSFATLIIQNKKIWSAPLFAIYDGKAFSIKDFIKNNRKNMSWNDGFLDKLIEISKIYNT